MPPFHELAIAAYCPRKLYYQRRADDRDPPPDVETIRSLAFRYRDLLAASVRELAGEPIEPLPAAYQNRLERSRKRVSVSFATLCEPAERDVLVDGRDCRGRVHKVLALDGPVPSVISTGSPPDEGVWEPQSVRAVAAARALAWREGTPVERAIVEYPAYGVIREIRLTTQRVATYRRVVRTVDTLDGPPAKINSDAKCASCEFRAECGVQTRSLRSLLG